MHDTADGKPKKPMYFAHPCGVTGRKVVIDGDDMDALALKRIEV